MSAESARVRAWSGARSRAGRVQAVGVGGDPGSDAGRVAVAAPGVGESARRRGAPRGGATGRTARASRCVCGAFFVGAGVLHFATPQTFEQIVPPGFGDPHALVLLSGAAEIIGGLSLARRDARWFSRWWLIGLLVAVFPANVYMALDPGTTGSFGLPRSLLWVRLPLQAVGIWCVWNITKEKLRVQLPT
jgi:uncharacterized membrane protein